MHALKPAINLRHEVLAELLLHSNHKYIWNSLRAKYENLPHYSSGRYFINACLPIEYLKRPITLFEMMKRTPNGQTTDGINRWVKSGHLEASGKFPVRYSMTEKGRLLWENFLQLVRKDLENRDKYIALFS